MNTTNTNNGANKMEKINANTYGQIINNLFNHSVTGSAMSVALRIVREPSGYRVDINNGFGPWEAVDGGAPLATLKAAQALASDWKRRAKAQQTYQPS